MTGPTVCRQQPQFGPTAPSVGCGKDSGQVGSRKVWRRRQRRRRWRRQVAAAGRRGTACPRASMVSTASAASARERRTTARPRPGEAATATAAPTRAARRTERREKQVGSTNRLAAARAPNWPPRSATRVSGEDGDAHQRAGAAEGDAWDAAQRRSSSGSESGSVLDGGPGLHGGVSRHQL